MVTVQFLFLPVNVSKYLLALPPFLRFNTSNLPMHVNTYNSYNSLFDSISVFSLLLLLLCIFGPAQLPSLPVSFFFPPYSSEMIFHFTNSYLLWYLPFCNLYSERTVKVLREKMASLRIVLLYLMIAMCSF